MCCTSAAIRAAAELAPAVPAARSAMWRNAETCDALAIGLLLCVAQRCQGVCERALIIVAPDNAWVSFFGVPDLARFVNVFVSQPDFSGGRQTFCCGRFTLRGDLSAQLCRVIHWVAPLECRLPGTDAGSWRRAD